MEVSSETGIFEAELLELFIRERLEVAVLVLAREQVALRHFSLIDLLLVHVHEDQEMRTLYPQSSLELETK